MTGLHVYSHHQHQQEKNVLSTRPADCKTTVKRFTSIMVSKHDTFNLTVCLLLVLYFTTLTQRCNQTNLLSSCLICDGRNIWPSSSSERVLPHQPVSTPTTAVYTTEGRSDTMTDRGVSLGQIGKRNVTSCVALTGCTSIQLCPV